MSTRRTLCAMVARGTPLQSLFRAILSKGKQRCQCASCCALHALALSADRLRWPASRLCRLKSEEGNVLSLKMSGRQAEQLAELVADTIKNNSAVMRGQGGYVYTIEATVLRRGLSDLLRKMCDPLCEDTGIDRLVKRAERELAQNETLLVENEYGRWQRMRFEAAKEFMARDLEHPNMALSFEQMGQRARQAADELLKALGIEPPGAEA